MSWTPRFFSSVTTCNQNFSPSFSEAHIPRTSLAPSVLMPIAATIPIARYLKRHRTEIALDGFSDEPFRALPTYNGN